MNSVNRKSDSSVHKTTSLKVEPTLRITLKLSALSIACSPDTVMIVTITNYPVHVSRIKLAVEKDLLLTRL